MSVVVEISNGLVVAVLLLYVNNLVGAVREDHASLIVLGTNRVAVAELNYQSYVLRTSRDGVLIVSVAVYEDELNVSAHSRLLNASSHLVPLVADLNLVVALGTNNLALNNFSLLDAAVLVSVVASSGDNNVVILLQAVSNNVIVVVVLARLGVDIVGTNVGNLGYLVGLNLQDGVVRRTVSSSTEVPSL